MALLIWAAWVVIKIQSTLAQRNFSVLGNINPVSGMERDFFMEKKKELYLVL